MLDSKVVTFLWDGEAIADSETLVGLGVEDDDLIDVKVKIMFGILRFVLLIDFCEYVIP